ncbi:glycosyltransferase family 2 protein [Paenibacillus chartarius]|uniref:Glycosyltransferase family 2 protein n=1 Tax=Paenibacillus chartarius TaxID=747481 RepID=A0ABV6DM75_9BACL
MKLFFNIVSGSAELLIFAVMIYQLFVSVSGLKKNKEVQTQHKPNRTFAILVAAHNEEKVIGALLDNLRQLNYPQDMYEIFVICDNCTDRTAAIAAERGVHAMVRTDPSRRGKGYAMEWMLERLWERERQYDAVVVLDADNLVDPRFLLEINNKLVEGHCVIQSYVDTKNPYDSWVSLSYAITYWFLNRMWQQSRYNWGLPSTLAGTGMVFEAKLLKEMGWNATSLTEDVEFTARCVQNDIYPTWAGRAIVYDEKPITLWSSIRQRVRWMRGHTECAKMYFKPLLLRALRTRKMFHLDIALYLFQPIRFMIGAAVYVMTYLQLATPLYTHFALLRMIPAWGWVVLNLVLFLQFPLIMFLERKPLKSYWGLILFPVFQFTWFPITFIGFITSKNKSWNHTVHTRSIRIEDVTR